MCAPFLPSFPITTEPKIVRAIAAFEGSINNSLIGRDHTGRMRAFFDKLSRREDCCVHIALVGGSNACGSGYPRHPWGRHQPYNGLRAAGMNRNYAALLVDWLNRGPTAACCGRGHRLTNLCQNGAGTDYFLGVFEPSTWRDLAPDLLLADLAPNDQNTFVARFLNRRVGHEKNTQVERATEALVRALIRLAPPAPALLYVVTAWFVDPLERDLADDEVHGGWPSHASVLRHYGLAATHLPMLLRGRAPLDGNYSHHHWYVDPAHYSLDAHYLQAWLLGRCLERLCHLIERAPDADELPRRPPPPLFPRTADAERDRVDLVDFTDRRGGFRRALLGASTGWQWVEATKGPDGTYHRAEVPPGALPAAESSGARGKLGYVSRHGAATFEVRARFRIGRLHVCHLRSYAGVGAVNVTVWRDSRNDTTVAGSSTDDRARAATHLISATTLNGTWALPYSLYTTARVALNRGSFRPNESLRVRVSRLPHAPGHFTVYTVASY